MRSSSRFGSGLRSLPPRWSTHLCVKPSALGSRQGRNEGSGRARPLIGSGTDLSRRHLNTPPPCLSVVIQLTPRKPNPATCWEIRDDSAGHVLIPIAVVELQVAI